MILNMLTRSDKATIARALNAQPGWTMRATSETLQMFSYKHMVIALREAGNEALAKKVESQCSYTQ